MKVLLAILLFCSPLFAQDLYIVYGDRGAVTLTSKRPASGARFKRVKGRKRPVYTPRPIESSFTHLVAAVAYRFDLDPNLINAVIHVESAFRANAVSNKGAMGLMQLMPGTAKDLGVKDPFHPLENIYGGTSYLSQMLKEFNGDLKLALAAYNAGPNAVKKYNNSIPPYTETQNYVQKVLAAKKMYQAESAKRARLAKESK